VALIHSQTGIFDHLDGNFSSDTLDLFIFILPFLINVNHIFVTFSLLLWYPTHSIVKRK